MFRIVGEGVKRRENKTQNKASFCVFQVTSLQHSLHRIYLPLTSKIINAYKILVGSEEGKKLRLQNMMVLNGP
jgi:hypothetical protein